MTADPRGHSLLNKPGGVAVDRECNVYIADIANNRLRCIGRDGTIRPFAGCGRFGYSGDGGDALDAEFQEIYGIGMSAAGDKLYLADYGNIGFGKSTCSRAGLIPLPDAAVQGTPGMAETRGKPVCKIL